MWTPSPWSCACSSPARCVFPSVLADLADSSPQPWVTLGTSWSGFPTAGKDGARRPAVPRAACGGGGGARARAGRTRGRAHGRAPQRQQHGPVPHRGHLPGEGGLWLKIRRSRLRTLLEPDSPHRMTWRAARPRSPASTSPARWGSWRCCVPRWAPSWTRCSCPTCTASGSCGAARALRRRRRPCRRKVPSSP